MTESHSIRNRPFIVLVIFVCTASAATGLVFGFIASIPYAIDHPSPGQAGNYLVLHVACVLGGCSGLVAGLVWCRSIVSKVIGDPSTRLVWLGTRIGAVVGILSTIILHGGLMITVKEWIPGILLIGLICGIVAGGILGAICGLACQRAAQSARKNIEIDQPGQTT